MATNVSSTPSAGVTATTGDAVLQQYASQLRRELALVEQKLRESAPARP